MGWLMGPESCPRDEQSIPFVIDNQQFRMSEVLNTLLTQYKGQSLDIASAYFNVGGWQLLAEGIHSMGSFRLLLGDEPEAGADLGLREVGARPIKGLIKDLANASFEEKTLRLIEDLTAFLNQEHVKVRLYTKGLLHAKSYSFIKELNLVHRANLAAEEITLSVCVDSLGRVNASAWASLTRLIACLPPIFPVCWRSTDWPNGMSSNGK